jgi:hypothetical protein
MRTDHIRSKINKAIKKENNTGEFLKNLQDVTDEKTAAAVHTFGINYLKMTPDLIEQVMEVASSPVYGDFFGPIFDTIFSYWGKKDDLIPDRKGVAGLFDDAYLSNTLLLLVANSVNPNTGAPLMPGLNEGLQQQNEAIAHLLGQAVSSQLNQIAMQNYQSVYVQNSLNAIFGAAGAGALFNAGALGAMQNALEQNRIEEQVNTQLGAMGIF